MADPQLDALKRKQDFYMGQPFLSAINKTAEIDPTKNPSAMDYVSGVANLQDSVTGAPTRSAISAGLNGENPINAFSGQFAEPPNEAATGKQIAEQLGASKSTSGLLGAGINFVADPLVLGGLATRAPLYAKEIADAPAILTAMRKSPGGYTKAAEKEFLNAMKVAGQTNDKIAKYTTAYSPEEITNFKRYLSPDQKSGFMVKPDSEITAVFSSEKGRGDDLVSTAISNGGRKLDSFDPYLPKKYSEHGFKEYARSPNWQPGGPDVVFQKMGAPHSANPLVDSAYAAALTRALLSRQPQVDQEQK